jgi:3-dehydrosphinganine reductase
MQNRHVLITGGSSGIGLALARRCADAGAKLSLIARDPAKLAAACAGIRADNPRSTAVVGVAADVAVEAELAAAIQQAEAAHGPVEVLITSAGMARPGRFEDVPTEVFERTMAVNYFGTLYALKAVVPGMRKRGAGSVVLISSGAGLVGLFGYTPYAPGKFALRGLAESLRAELKPAGVKVTIVYPPDTDTPQLAEENLTKPPETRALTAGAGLWTADDVARVTLKAVQCGKFSVTPGWQLTLLAGFHGLFAPFFRLVFDRIAAKAARENNQPVTR